MKIITVRVEDEDQPKVLKLLGDSGIVLKELSITTPRVRRPKGEKAEGQQ